MAPFLSFALVITLVSALPNVVTATKLVLTNDDGWAAANIRAHYAQLAAAGHNVVLSAPAENGSGTGSLDVPPTTVLFGCEFDSCPPLSPPTGSNASDPRLNYVNSFPVTSVKYGISTSGPPFFGGTKPDIVFSGPNVGANLGIQTLFSGTVGAACEASKEGIPAVAFSGAFDTQVGYTTLSTPSASTTAANVYAALGLKFLNALYAQSSSNILPSGVILNINYPNVTGSCTSPDAFKFVLSRVYSPTIFSSKDVYTCGSTRLPAESDVVSTDGCIASVSVMDASSKLDASATSQAAVLQRLGSFLTCLN